MNNFKKSIPDFRDAFFLNKEINANFDPLIKIVDE